MDFTALSKACSFVLRHGAQKVGVNIDKAGWVLVPDLLAYINRNYKADPWTAEHIKRMVKTSDKQRYALKEEQGNLYIRANQGHSMQQVEVEMTPITDGSKFPVVVHGTYKQAWPLIKKSGLSIMGRQHIHFAIGEPGSSQVISGMRKSAEIMIFLDLALALKDGLQFFLSANKVVLTPGIKGLLPTKYFFAVIDSSTRQPYDSDFPNIPASSKSE